jgi:hypothetical protein
MHKQKGDLFLERYKTENPNHYLTREKKTVFEKILQTPNSADDIEWCIDNGAERYKVNLCSLSF